MKEFYVVYVGKGTGWDLFTTKAGSTVIESDRGNPLELEKKICDKLKLRECIVTYKELLQV